MPEQFHRKPSHVIIQPKKTYLTR